MQLHVPDVRGEKGVEEPDIVVGEGARHYDLGHIGAVFRCCAGERYEEIATEETPALELAVDSTARSLDAVDQGASGQPESQAHALEQ